MTTMETIPMKPKHGERGASLVETVIVMGVLLALMFGIIDFGRALYTYSFVAQLARQGARWAIVRGANCTVLARWAPRARVTFRLTSRVSRRVQPIRPRSR